MHDFHGPKIRKYAQYRSQLQQSLLGSYPGIRIRPFWSAYSAEQDGIAFFTTGYRVGGQWVTDGINSSTAKCLFAETEIMAMPRCDFFENFATRERYLGSDTVAGQQRNQGVQRRFSSNVRIASECCSR